MSFSLIDHEGNMVEPQDLVGSPALVFFGFTFCPDVCPTTLSDISGWLDELGDQADNLSVIFISIDPERDSVEVMAEYVSYFHPAVRGWTGDLAQVSQAVDQFRAMFEKVPTDNGNYTMNHTASVFLFNDKGDFVSTVDYHEPREFAVPKIQRSLKSGP